VWVCRAWVSARKRVCVLSVLLCLVCEWKPKSVCGLSVCHSVCVAVRVRRVTHVVNDRQRYSAHERDQSPHINRHFFFLTHPRTRSCGQCIAVYHSTHESPYAHTLPHTGNDPTTHEQDLTGTTSLVGCEWVHFSGYVSCWSCCESLCVCVCVCVWERERAMVRKRDSLWACLCVFVWCRCVRTRACACVMGWGYVRVCVCACECVCVCKRERACEPVCVYLCGAGVCARVRVCVW